MLRRVVVCAGIYKKELSKLFFRFYEAIRCEAQIFFLRCTEASELHLLTRHSRSMGEMIHETRQMGAASERDTHFPNTCLK